MYQKLKGNRKGFTLAELLIVIAIIAILAAIAIPVYTTQMTKARVRVNEANIRSAKSIAVAEYLLSDDKTVAASYPFTVSGSNLTMGSSGTATGTGEPTADTLGKQIYNNIVIYLAAGGQPTGSSVS